MCKQPKEYFVEVQGFDIEVKVKDFFNAELAGMNVVLTDKKGEIVAICEAGDSISAFKKRKKLKAVVKSVKNGVVRFQIVRWADLHRHSGFSLLDGGNRIPDMVAKTEYAGAITDHGAMFGVLEYYKQMNSAGKLPILGFEGYVETKEGVKDGNHLLLLAKNTTGFKNLMALTSKSYDNFYRKPHISYDMLEEYGEGIISSTSCMGSEVSQLLLKGKYEEAKFVAKTMANFFGKDDYYVEIQRHGFQEEDIVNPQLMELARELDLKIIGTTDSHYLNEEDAYDHEVLLCIGTGAKMSDEKRMKLPGSGYHIHTSEEVEELFSDIPEALDNTLEIAEKCSGLELELNQIHMPHFPVPVPFKSESEYFRHLCWTGFESRFKGTPMFDSPEYRERLEFEISTIEKMGFPGYFLIVWDFVSYAKRNYHLASKDAVNAWKAHIQSNGYCPDPILVGPGRGSVVGALCAYVLDITDLDPIPLGLLFERFLNPDRISMPDIDLDFPDDRRDEVINYVRDKYGEEAVAKIITFGTLSARSVVRDVARVLDFPISLANRVAKSIPAVPKMTLKKAFDESPEFAQMYKNEPDVKKIVDTAMKLEGLPRHASIHACGLIIAPSAVHNYIPEILMENEDLKVKERTIQLNMSEAEEMGLLKMDFLGLRTMTVISRTLDVVNKKRVLEGLNPLHYLDIPINDKKVYQDIAKGESYGVFQLESAGMRSFMKDLFADAGETEGGTNELFERLVAGVSLFRPGPLDYIPDYIKNMRNPDYIQYDHPKLESLLKDTYGVIVYQEQCMFIVRELADFTKGEADSVRKAFAKKKEEMIAPLGEKFVKGCLKNGIEKEVAERIWDKMKEFGKYALMI